jgi:glycosyltransferase involved in cell wall biosynthesis
MDSIRHVYASFEKALHDKHQLIYRPSEYFYAPKSRKQALLKEFFAQCDVLMGHIEAEVLETREDLGKSLPLLGFLFGAMSRGAMDLSTTAEFLKTTDVLIGNCTADLEIARKFFTDAQTRLLPFAFDESTFYPLSKSEIQALRREANFSDKDKILFYSGRLTVEKNIHTILRIFSILQRLNSDVHLVIAGARDDYPFSELGVYPLNMERMLSRLVAKLAIPQQQVHFLGRVDADELNRLYNIADLMVSLTLHHDENFGYAQVEAMACGTPVIGTCWGGLKDTIIDGETGYHVGTTATYSGVKLNWWEAVNKIASLLDDDSKRQSFSRRSREHVFQNYSLARYRQNIESMLTSCVETGRGIGKPLRITSFARQFWCTCSPRTDDRPAYQRGQRSFELYLNLIAPFTGVTDYTIGAEEPLQPDQILSLSHPVILTDDGKVRVNDPIFPIDLLVPDKYRECVHLIFQFMKKEPVISVERLADNYIDTHSTAHESLNWMLSAGLLLRTRPGVGCVAPSELDARISDPLFSIQHVDCAVDMILIR